MSTFMSVRLEVRRHQISAPWTYGLLDQRQREIAQEIQAGGDGALLLSELAPVITLGRRAKSDGLLLSLSALARKGIDVYPTDRGGLETYHGPGQWVVFAVDRLDRLTGDSRGVQKIVQALLQVAVKTARIYRINTDVREGAELGVWTSRGKIAAVGVHVSHGVVLHGLSFNVYRTETSFMGLRPCGLDAPVDFLKSGEPFSATVFDQVGTSLAEVAQEGLWGAQKTASSTQAVSIDAGAGLGL